MKYRILFRVNTNGENQYALQTKEWYGWANCYLLTENKRPAWASEISWYTRREAETFYREAMAFLRPINNGVVVKEGEV
jgi:hypothetical protein